MLFPEEGLVYDYCLDDAGISLPALEEEEEEELRAKKVRLSPGQVGQRAFTANGITLS